MKKLYVKVFSLIYIHNKKLKLKTFNFSFCVYVNNITHFFHNINSNVFLIILPAKIFQYVYCYIYDWIRDKQPIQWTWEILQSMKNYLKSFVIQDSSALAKQKFISSILVFRFPEIWIQSISLQTYDGFIFSFSDFMQSLFLPLLPHPHIIKVKLDLFVIKMRFFSCVCVCFLINFVFFELCLLNLSCVLLNILS